MNDIFVRLPKLGDYVCKRVRDKKVAYIDWENPRCPSGDMFEVDGEQWEKIGSAVPYGKQVICAWREKSILRWTTRRGLLLGGYVLDGTDRQGTLRIREASTNNYGTNVDYVVQYNATTLDELAAQLNVYFASTAPFGAEEQDWWARVVDGEVELTFDITNQPQIYTTLAGNFSVKQALPLNVPNKGYPLMSNGNVIWECSITNWHYSKGYFSADMRSLGNPGSDRTSVKGAALTLPAYLGESAYQSDHCAFLRSVYGEGREGWLRYMESVLLVNPTDYHSLGGFSGKRATAMLAPIKGSSPSSATEPMYPAHNWCHGITSATVSEGEFWFPSLRELLAIITPVRYGASGYSTADCDALNASRDKAGWPLISSANQYFSSECMGYTCEGVGGIINSAGHYAHLLYSSSILPVSIYPIN